MLEDYLASLSNDELEALRTKLIIKQVETEMKEEKYHKIKYFNPYDFQKKFFNAGKHYRRRMLSAANRLGKTYSVAQEVSFHVTGVYPEWWDGARLDGQGRTQIVWCIGVDTDSTRKVLQKELLGTNDIRDYNNIGTGAIPRDKIDFGSFMKDGPTCKQFKVNREDGTQWEVHFYAASHGEAKLMGQTIILAWHDEPPPNNELEINLYTQAATRTLTTDGISIITQTPEQGCTPLYNMFKDKKELYFQNATWDDAPHITPKMKQEMLEAFPKEQWDLRSKGIPVLGKGAVFPFDISKITVDDSDYTIQPYWRCNAGLDFGYSPDPMVVMYTFHDPVNDIYYIHDELTLMERDPEEVHFLMKQHNDYHNIKIQYPHDGEGRVGRGSITKAEALRKGGCRTSYSPFINDDVFREKGQHSFAIEPGLSYIRSLIRDGKLRINARCRELLKEMALYQYKSAKEYSGPDHHVDALRYALMSYGRNAEEVMVMMDSTRDEWIGTSTDAPQQKDTSLGGWDYAGPRGYDDDLPPSITNFTSYS